MKDEKPALLNEIEYKGLWWLPDAPEKQFWGILKYTPNEGALLELMGNLGDDFNAKIIILGKVINGKEITLYKCHERENFGWYSDKQLQITKIIIQIVFIGAHFYNKKELFSNKVYVHYSNLDEWVNTDILNVIDYNPNEYIIKCGIRTINLYSDKDWKIKIIISPVVHKIIRLSFSIKYEAFIELESVKGNTFDEFMKLIRKLCNFMSFALNCASYPLKIKLLKQEKELNTKEVVKGNIVEVLPTEVFHDIYYEDKYRPIPYMLIKYNDIKHDGQNIIRKWMKLSDKMQLGLDMYFSTIYNSHMFLEHQFITLYQAFEAYFRYKNHGELNMKKAIQQLFNGYSIIINNIKIDKNDFINKMIITRQQLTHSHQKNENKSFRSGELYPIILKLRIIFMACLLSELGYDLEDINKFLSKSLSIRRFCETALIKWE